MTSSQDTGSSPDGNDPPPDAPSPDWLKEQWSVLADILDVSDPQKVVSRVRALQEKTDHPDDTVEGEGQTEPAFGEMREQLERLRSKNADLADRAASASARPQGTEELHPETEVLLDQLDAASLPEAQERIRSLSEQLENLYSEKEALAEAGLMSSREALDEIDRLQKKCDRLRSEHQASGDAASQPSLLDSREEEQELRRLAREIVEGLDAVATTVNAESSALDAPSDDLPALMRAAHEQVTVLLDTDFSSSQNGEIAEVLGVTSVEEARDLDRTVRRLGDRLEALHREKNLLSDRLGVADADDLLDLVESLENQLSALYEEQDDARQRDGTEIPTEIEDILGISSAEEARELVSYVHEMNDRLEQLAAEHETLLEKGFDAETAVAMIDSMEDQLVDLYGTANPSRNGTQSQSTVEGASASLSENEVSEQAITDILGISSPSEARELDRLVRRMSAEFNRLRSETEKLAASDLTAETALEMIETMEDQLVDLYHAHDKRTTVAGDIEPLEHVLGVQIPEDEEGASLVSTLVRQIQDLLDAGRAALSNGKDATTVRSLIRELSARLKELQDERDQYAGQAERLNAIQDVLGISTLDEARELTTLVQNLDTQLQALYAEREKLNEVGLSSVEDAVDMIRSMEGQLRELYEEQEALRDLPDRPEQQDTFQQLESLYKEQEKLKRALGVSDAEEVIEMVEDLTAQLDDVYADQEQDSGAGDAPTSDSSSDESSAEPVDAEVQMTLDSMQHQLEMLYDEKEVLLERGFESAEEATARIDDLQNQVQTLRQKHADCQDRMDRLEAEFGTNDASEIIQMVEGLQNRPTWPSDASSELPSSAELEASDDPFVNAAPSLLPKDTLGRLDALSSSDLEELPVGVLRLDDDGKIRDLNTDGLQFPGLDASSKADVVGARLFERVPGTSNTLFLGRFKRGVAEGEMDARFPYTFVTPGDQPAVFFVHLYRTPERRTNWVLFRPA